MPYSVYILESIQTARWYIGSTEDIAKRLQKHNAGHVRSSKPYAPYKVIWIEEYGTRSEAVKREHLIKKSGRIRKEIQAKIKAPSSNG